MVNSAYLQAAGNSVFKLSWAPTKAKVGTSRERCSRKAGPRRPRAPRATRGLHRQQPGEASSARGPPERHSPLWVWSLLRARSPHPNTPALEEGWGLPGLLRWRKPKRWLCATGGSVFSGAPRHKARKSVSAELTVVARAAEGEKRQQGPGWGRGLTPRGVSGAGRGRSLGGRERCAHVAGLQARAGRYRES